MEGRPDDRPAIAEGHTREDLMGKSPDELADLLQAYYEANDHMSVDRIRIVACDMRVLTGDVAGYVRVQIAAEHKLADMGDTRFK